MTSSSSSLLGLTNGFAFEVIGIRMDALRMCRKQLPDFTWSKQAGEVVSRLQSAPKTSRQIVDLTCHFIVNNLVNPYVTLDFKVRDLRLDRVRPRPTRGIGQAKPPNVTDKEE